VKITGTLPSLASSAPCDKSDSFVIPTTSCVEHSSSSTSLIDESLESDVLPLVSLGATMKEIPDGVSHNDLINNDLANNDNVLEILEFPTDEDDMELGNFLLDAADWL